MMEHKHNPHGLDYPVRPQQGLFTLAFVLRCFQIGLLAMQRVTEAAILKIGNSEKFIRPFKLLSLVFIQEMGNYYRSILQPAYDQQHFGRYFGAQTITQKMLGDAYKFYCFQFQKDGPFYQNLSHIGVDPSLFDSIVPPAVQLECSRSWKDFEEQQQTYKSQEEYLLHCWKDSAISDELHFGDRPFAQSIQEMLEEASDFCTVHSNKSFEAQGQPRVLPDSRRRLDWARSHALTNALKACATLINTQNTQELISPVGFLAERVDLAKSLDTLYQVNDDELRAKGDLSFITPLKLNMDKYIPGGRVPRLAWEERKGVKKHAFVWEEEAEHGKEDQRLHPQLQGSFYSFGAALHPRYKMRRWVGSGL